MEQEVKKLSTQDLVYRLSQKFVEEGISSSQEKTKRILKETLNSIFVLATEAPLVISGFGTFYIHESKRKKEGQRNKYFKFKCSSKIKGILNQQA